MQAFDQQLDTSGLLCPVPLIKTRSALKELKPGQTLLVISTDPAAEIDFKVFTSVTDNKLVHYEKINEKYYFLIRKA